MCARVLGRQFPLSMRVEGPLSARAVTPSHETLFHVLEYRNIVSTVALLESFVPGPKRKFTGSSSIGREAAPGASARSNNPYSIEVLRRAIDILSVFQPLAAVDEPRRDRTSRAASEDDSLSYSEQPGRAELLRMGTVRPGNTV